MRSVLDEWLGMIHLEAGETLDLALVDAAGGVVETLQAKGRGLRGTLRRLGNTTGDLGWPLDLLNAWVGDLANLVGRSRRADLLSFDCVCSLSEGWAERHVRGPRADSCTDAVTGLATPAVLRLRLREVYQQCRAYGLLPTEAYCFVVVDADTGDLAPF